MVNRMTADDEIARIDSETRFVLAAPMRFCLLKCLCSILLALIFFEAGGCSGKAVKKKGAVAGSGNGETKETLPAIDLDTAIPVDDGKIRVASPIGWTRSSRSKDYLVRFLPGPKKSYPSISVTVADSPNGFDAITDQNQQQFVDGIAVNLEGDFSKNGKSSVLKKPVGVKLGPHLGAAWAVPGTAKVSGLNEPIERWVYAVVIGGRMYTVEARAPKGKVDAAAKMAAKAVAGGLAVPSAEPVEPALEPAERPAVEPAEPDAESAKPETPTESN